MAKKIAPIGAVETELIDLPSGPIKVDAGYRKPGGKAKVASIGPVKINNPDENPVEGLTADQLKEVEIFVDEELFINGKRLYGNVKMPLHQAQSIIPMLQSKKRADLEMFTGRNFIVRRMANNTLVIKELGTEEEL